MAYADVPDLIQDLRERDAIAGAIIAFMDQIDDDCDLEETAPERFGAGFVPGHGEDDEGAQCDDEGVPDDNGLADPDGLLEQRPEGRFAYG